MQFKQHKTISLILISFLVIILIADSEFLPAFGANPSLWTIPSTAADGFQLNNYLPNSLDQTPSSCNVNSGGASGSCTVSITNVQVGDTLIVGYDLLGAATFTTPSDGVNAYVPIGSRINSPLTTSGVELWYANANVGGSLTITCAYTGGGGLTNINCFVQEYEGLLTSFTASSGSGTSNSPAVTSFTPCTPCAVVGVVSYDSPATVTVGADYTLLGATGGSSGNYLYNATWVSSATTVPLTISPSEGWAESAAYFPLYTASYVKFNSTLYSDVVSYYTFPSPTGPPHVNISNAAFGASTNPVQYFGVGVANSNYTISLINSTAVQGGTSGLSAGQTKNYVTFFYQHNATAPPPPTLQVVVGANSNYVKTTILDGQFYTTFSTWQAAAAPAVYQNTTGHFLEVNVSAPSTLVAFNSRASFIRSETVYIPSCPAVLNALYCIPITISNTQTSATSTGLQEMLKMNWNSYSSLLANPVSNINFVDPTGNPLYAWIENGTSNVATNSVVWVNLGTNTIPANGAITIFLEIYSTGSNQLSPTGSMGECPTCTGSYGQYDNGPKVFNYYDNFNGTSLSSAWTSTDATHIVTHVNNGLTITSSASAWSGLENNYVFLYNQTVDSLFNEVNASEYSEGGPQGSAGQACQFEARQSNVIYHIENSGCTSVTNSPYTAGDQELLTGYWSATPVLDANYTQEATATFSGTVSTTGLDLFVYSNIAPSKAGSFVQWIRVRTSPPNNVMPTTIVGAAVTSGTGLSRLFVGFRSMSNLVSISSTLNRLVHLARSAANLVTITDLISKVKQNIRSITNLVTVSDTIKRLYKGSRTLSITVTITDTAARVAKLARSTTNLITILVTISRLFEGSRTISEAAVTSGTGLSRLFAGFRSISNLVITSTTPYSTCNNYAQATSESSRSCTIGAVSKGEPIVVMVLCSTCTTQAPINTPTDSSLNSYSGQTGSSSSSRTSATLFTTVASSNSASLTITSTLTANMTYWGFVAYAIPYATLNGATYQNGASGGGGSQSCSLSQPYTNTNPLAIMGCAEVGANAPWSVISPTGYGFGISLNQNNLVSEIGSYGGSSPVVTTVQSGAGGNNSYVAAIAVVLTAPTLSRQLTALRSMANTLTSTPTLSKLETLYRALSELIFPLSECPSIPNAVYCVPITLSNTQTSATSTGLQEMLNVDWNSYSSLLANPVTNINFVNSFGSPLYSWIENGTSNTATNSIVWVNLGSNIIPASGSITIFLVIYATGSNQLSSSGYTGECPTCTGTYGQYDNGPLVFTYYDNFNGTSLSSAWTVQVLLQ